MRSRFRLRVRASLQSIATDAGRERSKSFGTATGSFLLAGSSTATRPTSGKMAREPKMGKESKTGTLILVRGAGVGAPDESVFRHECLVIRGEICRSTGGTRSASARRRRDHQRAGPKRVHQCSATQIGAAMGGDQGKARR